jgi:CheY-like chemotaxis protein
VKGLVELHGGTVSVASDGPDTGARFTVRLPTVGAPSAPKPSAPPAPKPGGARRVLLIDDNPDAVDAIRELLELDGHITQVATDGATGLRRAREFKPDVVICDIGLPGMTGYEVAKAIRHDETVKNTYLVALTGYGRPIDQERAMVAGFNCHMTKPARVDDLAKVIRNAPHAAA